MRRATRVKTTRSSVRTLGTMLGFNCLANNASQLKLANQGCCFINLAPPSMQPSLRHKQRQLLGSWLGCRCRASHRLEGLCTRSLVIKSMASGLHSTTDTQAGTAETEVRATDRQQGRT